MSTTIVTNMWKPRGTTYYSSTKNEVIPIKDMNYMHLANAIRSIEDDARATKRELRTTDPLSYNALEGLPLPALAATLCPQYLDLVEEYSNRNRNSNMTETTETQITQAQSQATADEITQRINELKTNARTSLDNVRQLAPSSVVSDLDDIARLMDEMDKLFEQQAKAQEPRKTQPITQETTPVQETPAPQPEATVITATVSEGPQNSATTIGKFKFCESHQVNIGVRRKINKYFPSVSTVGDLAFLTVMDMLTLFTGEQAYNIITTLWRDGISPSEGEHQVYLAETDVYPRRVEYFIKKPRFNREGFEKKTNVATLYEIPFAWRDKWIAEADRLHNNIQDRARDRYKVLSNYVAGLFSPNGETMDVETWINTLLGEECSQMTMDEVRRWFYKGV